jgi:hypothetical protein
VGVLGPFLKDTEGLDKPDMILGGMIDPGSVEYVGPAETKGLDKDHAFIIPGTGIKGGMIDSVGNHLYHGFLHPGQFHQFLLNPPAYGDNPVQPAESVGKHHTDNRSQMFPGLPGTPIGGHIMDRSYGRAGRFKGKPFVGGGKKTGVVTPARGKFRIPEKMPQRVGGPAVYGTPGNKIQVFGDFVEGIPLIFPAEQFIKGAGGGYSFQKLGNINTYPRNAAVAGEGVHPYLHSTSGINPRSEPVPD